MSMTTDTRDRLADIMARLVGQAPGAIDPDRPVDEMLRRPSLVGRFLNEALDGGRLGDDVKQRIAHDLYHDAQARKKEGRESAILQSLRNLANIMPAAEVELRKRDLPVETLTISRLAASIDRQAPVHGVAPLRRQNPACSVAYVKWCTAATLSTPPALFAVYDLFADRCGPCRCFSFADRLEQMAVISGFSYATIFGIGFLPGLYVVLVAYLRTRMRPDGRQMA